MADAVPCQTHAPILLTDQQAAELLGCSRSHFRDLHVGGGAPEPVRLGRLVRWRRDELVAWVNAGAPPRQRWVWEANRG